MSKPDDSKRPIVIRRRKKVAGDHLGGNWKIAYADFVTAMMAFFLLMWLLGSTTKGELEGIAEYFKNPLKVSLSGGSGSGDSSSLIRGGGKDLTRRDSQVKRGEIVEKKRTINLKAAQAELDRVELLRLRKLKGRIENVIEKNPTLRQFRKQLLLDFTRDGLRIQIVDEQNRPMFALGRAQLQPYTREILHEIGKVLNEVPNRLSLAGHTDAKPYAGGEKGYSNWELSADRANASRRELIAGGMEEAKVLRAVGLSSTVMLDSADPFNPVNRRISIIVMNRRAEESFFSEGLAAEVQGGAPPTAEMLAPDDAEGNPAAPQNTPAGEAR